MNMFSFPLLCKGGVRGGRSIVLVGRVYFSQMDIISLTLPLCPTLLLPLQKGGKWDLQSFKKLYAIILDPAMQGLW